MIGFLMLTSVLPLAALVLVSFEGFWSATIPWNRLGLRNYRSLFETPEVWSGLRNSVGLAVLCASITLLVGILVVLTVRRSPRVPGSVVDAIAKLPATLTHIVIALAFIIAFAGPPFRLGGTYVILGMAYVVLYLPQATFYATAALDQIGKQLSEASYVSGASGSMTLRRVLLPLMAPSLMAAWSLIFVLMTGDITASSMLASTHTPVVGFMIMDIWGAGSFPLLAALGVLMTIVASAVVVVVMRFRDRIVIVR
jgi:iron(III) transport system permease protein